MDSCPLSPWCYLTISSSATPFSFCLQSFPASGPALLNIHNIKFPILTILGVQLSGTEPVHIVVQRLSPSISRTVSSSQSETQHPLNKNSSFTPLFTTPDHHCSTFCFYEFDKVRYLIWVESYCICPFVTSWYHLAWYPQGSSSCSMVVACVWISFPGHFFFFQFQVHLLFLPSIPVTLSSK